MKKYVCTVCGYIFDESEGTLWEDLPSNWLCPLCGADKSAFEVQEETTSNKTTSTIELDEEIRDLNVSEMAALCSNLSKGCEKQYLPEEAKAFQEISEYFTSSGLAKDSDSLSNMIVEVNNEINETFKQANAVVDSIGDRGAKRALVWSEKVTRMLKSIISKYEKEGNAYLENTRVFVCEICGFIYIGDELPEVCPVCKVPNFKMKEIGRE